MNLVKEYFGSRELTLEQYKVLDLIRFMRLQYESKYDELKRSYVKKTGTDNQDPEELKQLTNQLIAKEAQLELFDDILRTCFNR